MIVWVNAGHNFKDTGAIWGALKENEITMKIRDALKDKIAEYGAIYIDDSLDLAKTIEVINRDAGSDDFAIDIHINFNKDESLRGVEAYYVDNPRYAEIFSRKVAETVGIPNRGPKPDSMSYFGYLGFLRKLKCPSVIVECFYISNLQDRLIYLEKEVEPFALGIKNALDTLFKNDAEAIKKLTEVKISLLQQILSALRDKLNKLLNNNKI